MLLTVIRRVVRSTLFASVLLAFGAAGASTPRSLVVVDRMVVELPLGFRGLRLSEVTSRYVMAQDPIASDERYWRHLLTTAVFNDASTLELRWTYSPECVSEAVGVSADASEYRGVQCISDEGFGTVKISFRGVFGVTSRDRAADYLGQVTVYIDGGSGGPRQLLEVGRPAPVVHPPDEVSAD